MADKSDSRLVHSSLHEDVANSLQWAAGLVQGELARLAKGAGLTLPQYQVLRILRDSSDALSCSEIADRMIARDPDVTRLIDKLVKAGLVARARDGVDRRVVRSRITDRGRAKVTPLDGDVKRLHQDLLAGIPETELRDWSRRLRVVGRSQRTPPNA